MSVCIMWWQCNQATVNSAVGWRTSLDSAFVPSSSCIICCRSLLVSSIGIRRALWKRPSTLRCLWSPSDWVRRDCGRICAAVLLSSILAISCSTKIIWLRWLLWYYVSFKVVIYLSFRNFCLLQPWLVPVPSFSGPTSPHPISSCRSAAPTSSPSSPSSSCAWLRSLASVPTCKKL